MYLTIEELEQHHIEQAFEGLSARGLPAVRGEVVQGDAAGYHYHPGRNQAVDWFWQQGLPIVDQGLRREDGWGYHHFPLRTSPASPAAGHGPVLQPAPGAASAISKSTSPSSAHSCLRPSADSSCNIITTGSAPKGPGLLGPSVASRTADIACLQPNPR